MRVSLSFLREFICRVLGRRAPSADAASAKYTTNARVYCSHEANIGDGHAARAAAGNSFERTNSTKNRLERFTFKFRPFPVTAYAGSRHKNRSALFLTLFVFNYKYALVCVLVSGAERI